MKKHLPLIIVALNTYMPTLTMERAVLFGLFACLNAFSIPIAYAQAQTLDGVVVSVSDGDTLRIVDSSNHQHKIRLSGIDAPERGQPFSKVSKKALSDLVLGKKVKAECIKRDKYEREVCKVIVMGRDANLALIREGFAWHYKKYEHDQSLEDRTVYSETEKIAKSARIGLWSDKNPQAPWDYRHLEKPRFKFSLPKIPPKDSF